ncbi:glycoside hydrolase family 28 protein [Sphingomonas sp. LT1P40]|uniref:glycoside hydrolase family 28 protein n=1 Tax=Alteristakelama amylovorans TaxID=3096166 RepID=UPI002FC79643
MIERRDLLAGGAASLLLASTRAQAKVPDSWAPVAAILARIRPPSFPARTFDIRRFGADPASKAKTTAAIRSAIGACARAGGGRVLIPAGAWPSAAIQLASRVDLHIAAGATLRFSNDPNDYLPMVLTRFEGVECMNYAPMIYAYGARDVAITGTGTIDAQASIDNWWSWLTHTDRAIVAGRTEGKNRLARLAEQGVPPQQRLLGPGAYHRPSFIQPYRCTNVLIDGPTITGSPMWIVHPVLCRNVTVRNIVIRSLGPNNDGCNPESCRDVLIEQCDFSAGDDCIAVKSGRNFDGRRVNTPSENIVVQNCRMRDGHGGVSLGSEASGGIRNVYVRNCRMGGSDLERALRLKSNSHRGGYIDNIVFRDIAIDGVNEAVLQVSLHYGEGAGGRFMPARVGGVLMENITCRASEYGVDLQGYPELPITNIRLRDCTFTGVRKGNRISHGDAVAARTTINGRAWTGETDRRVS